jgi:hypothetical protein
LDVVSSHIAIYFAPSGADGVIGNSAAGAHGKVFASSTTNRCIELSANRIQLENTVLDGCGYLGVDITGSSVGVGLAAVPYGEVEIRNVVHHGVYARALSAHVSIASVSIRNTTQDGINAAGTNVTIGLSHNIDARLTTVTSVTVEDAGRHGIVLAGRHATVANTAVVGCRNGAGINVESFAIGAVVRNSSIGRYRSDVAAVNISVPVGDPGYPDELRLLAGARRANNDGIVIASGADNVVVAGCTVSGNVRNGIMCDGKNLTVKNCWIGLDPWIPSRPAGNRGYGVVLGVGSSSVLIEKTQIGANGFLGVRHDADPRELALVDSVVDNTPNLQSNIGGGSRNSSHPLSQIQPHLGAANRTVHFANDWARPSACSWFGCVCKRGGSQVTAATARDEMKAGNWHMAVQESVVGVTEIDCIDDKPLGSDDSISYGSDPPTKFPPSLTSLRLINVGLFNLDWSELAKLQNLTIIDFAANAMLPAVPPSGKYKQRAFGAVRSLSLRGTDLSRVQNDTFQGVRQTLESLDLSHPAVAPNTSVAVNLTGFRRLRATLWYNNWCPAGFYATSSHPVYGLFGTGKSGLCARCPAETVKLASGGVGVEQCLPCTAGTVDADKDPTTPCTLPVTFRCVDGWLVNLRGKADDSGSTNRTTGVGNWVDGNSTADRAAEDNEASYAAPVGGYLHAYTRDETYELDSVNVSKAELFVGYALEGVQAAELTIVYGLRFKRLTTGVADASTDAHNGGESVVTGVEAAEGGWDATPGKFFVAGSGGALGTPSQVGRYAGELYARDAASAVAVVRRWTFSVEPPDTDDVANGPGGAGCLFGAAVDDTPLDRRFSCDCGGSSHTGPNCAVAATAAATTGRRGAVAVGSVLGVLALAAVVVAVAQWLSVQRLRNRAHDFHTQLAQLRAAGELDTSQGQLPREVLRRAVVLVQVLGNGPFIDSICIFVCVGRLGRQRAVVHAVWVARGYTRGRHAIFTLSNSLVCGMFEPSRVVNVAMRVLAVAW